MLFNLNSGGGFYIPKTYLENKPFFLTIKLFCTYYIIK